MATADYRKETPFHLVVPFGYTFLSYRIFSVVNRSTTAELMHRVGVSGAHNLLEIALPGRQMTREPPYTLLEICRTKTVNS